MVREVGAEFLLNYLYPGLRKEWSSVMRGSFYRNYSDDILTLDVENKYVELSRDSFLKLMPEVMLSPEDEKGNNELKHRRLQLLEEAFAPVDTFHFKTKLNAERQVADLLANKLRFILKNYFDYDIDAETSDYCRQIAPLLPYTSRFRGDLHFIRRLLSTVTGHPVRMKQTAWSNIDNSRYWMPKVYYNIIIDGLSPSQYKAEMANLTPLSQMLKDRFIPFDTVVEIGIKGKNPSNQILDYNTKTKP